MSSLHTGSFWTFVASLCAAVQRGAGSSCWSLAINCVRGGCGGWAGRSSGWRVSGWPSSLRCFSALPSTTPGLSLPGDSCAAPVDGDRPRAACSACSWKPHCRVGRGGPLFSGSQFPPQERWVWRGVWLGFESRLPPPPVVRPQGACEVMRPSGASSCAQGGPAGRNGLAHPRCSRGAGVAVTPSSLGWGCCIWSVTVHPTFPPVPWGVCLHQPAFSRLLCALALHEGILWRKQLFHSLKKVLKSLDYVILGVHFASRVLWF